METAHATGVLHIYSSQINILMPAGFARVLRRTLRRR